MTTPARARYTGYRFPAEIIGHAVWLYFRFPLGLRMVEEYSKNSFTSTRLPPGASARIERNAPYEPSRTLISVPNTCQRLQPRAYPEFEMDIMSRSASCRVLICNPPRMVGRKPTDIQRAAA